MVHLSGCSAVSCHLTVYTKFRTPSECVVTTLDTAIALLAAQLNKDHKLATADAIVYATALNKGATLLTCDAHFEHLPHVVYLSKKTIH
jgi:predicted nucleic acid-binding protein